MILEKELSYKLQGCVYNVANKYGAGLKETIYEKALAEELEKEGIKFEEQKRINIYSIESGKILGTYIPDFIVEEKIVLEIKATEFTAISSKNQQQSYLKASKYEIGYLINFGTPELYMKRFIFTNDRKPFLRLINS